jgi:Tetratricopeptide Repeats-Sensor
MVIALAGRRVDAAGAPARFPAENVTMVAGRLRKLFRTEGASIVVASAACGADLVALREARALGLRRRVVLPFDRQAFRSSSVTDRPGDWGSLFDSLVDEAAAANDLVTLQGQATDAAYAAANTAVLQEAQALGRATGQEVCAVMVWNGQSRGGEDLTDTFAQAAREQGLRVIEVLTLRTCFVVQGFGEKTDLSTGRVLNLDASYDVIKEAVEEAGLRCVRADEIIHSGTIDKPMYEWLYRADLVIADLSTYNVNAAYELGIRYGLRPSTTIIVAENQFKNPFDVGHIITLPYEHLGKDVGRKEAGRFKGVLIDRIRALLQAERSDSPVYTYLSLRPPEESATVDSAEPVLDKSPSGGATAPAIPGADTTAAPWDDANAKELLERARAALGANRFSEAKGLLFALHAILPRDVFVLQQLALATYKSKVPDPVTALKEARGYLEELRPDTTNDPETLGLWGAVHKRLWDHSHDRHMLDGAIAAYERGFYLKQDYYTGINLAFLLDVRASLIAGGGERAEAIADAVIARRVRRQVLEYCTGALAASSVSTEGHYWIVATQWEAALGLNDAALIARFRAEAEAAGVAGWMLESTRQQISQLEQLLAVSPLNAIK